jgi:Aminoglycoside adenylyltransferase, C-terminal domain/Nucleotidyltransferase domain
MTTHAPPPFNRILPALVDDLRATLGDELVGAYLFGSAISGGFDPAVSDLDLAVVTESPVDAQPFERFAGIVERLQVREPDWAGRLDIVFVGRSTLADFRAGGGPFIEISHEEGLELKRRADEWLETWYLVREADWPILGPAPSALIPPISADEFLQEVVKGIPHFIDPARNKGTDGWLAYRTLTLCRLLRSLESRALCSKIEGATWAMERYPDQAALIRAALEVRATDGRRPFTSEERAAIPALLELLASEVAREAAARA